MPDISQIESEIQTHFQGEGIELERDEDLFSSGQVDSMALMQAVAHLEGAYGLKIPPGDLVPENFRTIEVMADYVNQRC